MGSPKDRLLARWESTHDPMFAHFALKVFCFSCCFKAVAH